MNTLVASSTISIIFMFCLFVKNGDAILCWECNSAHDPRCGEYKFDNHTLAAMDCSQLEKDRSNGVEPKYCRKVIQKIGTENRVIRGCGWIYDNKARDYCYTRTGTKNIMVTYCQCEHDRCNLGTTSRITWIPLAISLLLVLKLF